jgi:hypothetical protein
MHYEDWTAPRRPTGGTYSNSGRFDQINQSGARGVKKTVIKQVYCVKKDGRKAASLDLISNDKRPIKVLATSAIDGKEVKQAIVDNQVAKSECGMLEVPKLNKEFPTPKSKSEPRCPLRLSSWQGKNLQRLSAEQLKKKNMALVPKGTNQIQDMDNGRASVPMEAMRSKKKKGVKKQVFSQRLASDHYYLGPSYHPYSLAMPLGPMSWSLSSSMFGYPSWSYYEPWVQSLYRGGVPPNYYTLID